MILVNTGKAVASGGGYTGPGDVVSGATAWWGLRAYNNAYATTGLKHLIDVTDSAGGNLVTIDCTSTGALDISAYNTWATAHSVTAGTALVNKLYDQTGHGIHLLQTGASTLYPQFIPTGVLRLLLAASIGNYLISGNYTQAQPLTLSMIAQRNTDASAANSDILRNNNTGDGIEFLHQSGGTTFKYGVVNATATSTTFALATATPIQYLANGGGTASKMFVAGATTTGADTTSGFAAEPIALVASAADPNAFTEGGFWPGDQSTFFAALETNQKTFWGI